jgi:hypothetical protein
MNSRLLRTRLGQYGAAWFMSFLVVLVIGLVGRFAVHLDLVPLADLVLPVMLAGLGLLLVAFFVMTVFARESLTTKLVLIVLGLILALPLLWAPVLAVVVDAAMTKTSIEYSNAYANFRIVVGRLLFPAAQAVFGGNLVSAAWTWFQAIATVIGFVAAVSQLWPMLQRSMGGRTAAG